MKKSVGSFLAINRKGILLLGVVLCMTVFGIAAWRSSATSTSNKVPNLQANGSPSDSVTPFGPLAATAGSDDKFGPETVKQILALENEKNSRSKTEQKIDSQLLQGLRESRRLTMAPGVNLEPVNIGVDDKGRLSVDISADVSDDLVNRIEGLGGRIIFPSWEYNTIRAEIDLSSVEAIAALSEVKFVQPAVQSITSRSNASSTPLGSSTDQQLVVSGNTGNPASASRTSFAARAARVRSQLTKILSNNAGASNLNSPFVGTVSSQGDKAHRADNVRNVYGFGGQGIRIGVLSDSFNAGGGAASDIASGNLPGPGNPLGNTTPVTVVQDFAGASDEGRAMMQIVHDLAPKAQLFFATADVSEAGFASNIVALRNAPNNCDIIIDDVFYFDEPVFQDGIVAQAVNTVTASGALYFSSAGNEGNVVKGTAGYYEGDFNDSGSLAFTFPGGAKAGTIHNFGTIVTPINGDIITTVSPNGYTLNWSDPATASGNDYDLFLISSAGTVKASSTNIQNGTQLPFEIVGHPALVAGDRIVVFKTAAAAVRAFAINAVRGTFALNTTGQTHGHSSAVDAFSVGATPAEVAFAVGAPAGPFPGFFTATNQVETFSSDGPRRVFYNANGTPITPGNFLFGTNGGNVRAKPDITAADGVATTGTGMGAGLNPFYGTSAAAPHAGAIAALIKASNPALTPAQIRTILTTTDVDIESPGYDNVSGFGIVQAFQAMQAVAPTPLATLLTGTVTPTEGSFKNNNGFIDPGEVGNLTVQLTNPSLVNATSVSATLTTNTPGITITQGTASYGTIAAAGNATNTGTPFIFGVNSTVLCGTTINFTLTVTFGGGLSPLVFQIPVTVGNQPFLSINGKLGTAPSTLPGMTSTSGQQTGRLSRSGVVSSCAAPKANPGLLAGDSGSRQFDAYTFTNTSPVSQCVQVNMSSPNGINLYTVAYTGAGFVPANPNTNYLADPGGSSSIQIYSFTVAAGATFTITVHDINVLPTSASTYSLSVGLANCTAGPACSAITVNPASIPAGATNVAYSQTFSATGGSGLYTFSESGALPTGLIFASPTLLGTPTQAGTFPISVTTNDVVGCSPGTRNYSLVIGGTVPASLAVSAGSPQTTITGTVFATQLQAIVKDSGNAGLGGVSVTFTAPGSGASGTFAGGGSTATVTTAANGIATAPFLTANSIAGSFNVTASVNALAPVNFSLTSVPPPPLSGSFTVGAGGNYPSLTNAGGIFEAINAAGASGNITINIVSNLSGELGTNGLNAVASPFTVLIKPLGAPRTITGSIDSNALIRLNGASRVTIDGSLAGGTDRSLTITNTSATAPSVVALESINPTPIVNDTLKNCVIINGTNTASAVVLSSTSLGAAGFFNNLTVQNNSIQRAYIGVFTVATAAAGNGSGTLITQNKLDTVGASALRLVGLYVQGTDGATVSNNSVGNIDPGDDENDTGIWLATGAVNTTVSGNTVSNIGYSGANAFAPYGIRDSAGLTTIGNNITGNSVTNITSSGSTAVRGIADSSGATRIQRNNIQGIINSNTGTYGAFGIDQTAGNNVVIRNNFVSNVNHDMTGGVAFDTTFGVVGIRIGAGTGHQIQNNSVNLYGPMTGTANGSLLSAAIGFTSTARTGMDIRNNIFANNITGGTTGVAHVAVSLPSGGTAAMNMTWNNNSYYYGTDAARQGAGHSGTTAGSPNRANLTALKAYTGTLGNATNDSASMESTGAVSFMSANNLHLFLSAPQKDLGATIAAVTDDFDGEPRPQITAYDIGADEITGVFAIDNVSKNEGNSGTTSFVFTVTRLGQNSTPASVQYTTLDGSATVLGGDYQSASGTLNFAAGDVSKPVTILVNGDTVVEPDETFAVHLFASVNGAIQDGDGQGLIYNDDGGGGPTPTPTLAPTPTPPAFPGFEGDINRTALGVPGNGDQDVNIADDVQYGRFLSGTDCPARGTTNPALNEQQRLDAGDRSTLGDGSLGTSDELALLAYARHDQVTDFNPNVAGWQPTPAGGPKTISNLSANCTSPDAPESDTAGTASIPEPESVSAARVVRVVSRSGARDSVVTVDIEMAAQGNEAGTQYSLRFDPSVLSISPVSGVNANPDILLGAGAPAGTTLNVNADDAASGRIGIGENFSAAALTSLPEGATRIARVRFHVLDGAASGTSRVDFDNSVINGVTSDVNGMILSANYEGGDVSVGASRGVTVSGRVTSSDGRGIRGATVTIVDGDGLARTATTSSFGFYTFDDVAATTYTIGVSSRQYRFGTRTIIVGDDLANVDFTGLE